jgi:hypothetical protein
MRASDADTASVADLVATLGRLGMLEKALDVYSHFPNGRSWDQRTQAVCGAALLKAGRKEESRLALTIALIGPEVDQGAIEGLVRVLADKGDTRDARRVLARLSLRSPETAAALERELGLGSRK